jgi:hypothetical protein
MNIRAASPLSSQRRHLLVNPSIKSTLGIRCQSVFAHAVVAPLWESISKQKIFIRVFKSKHPWVL